MYSQWSATNKGDESMYVYNFICLVKMMLDSYVLGKFWPWKLT